MGIPYWRYVDGTDDGCSIYECLSCKASWESRTAPGFDNRPNWFYCPVCGHRWEGELKYDTEKRFNKPVDNPRARTERIKNLCEFELQECFRSRLPDGSLSEPVWQEKHTAPIKSAIDAKWYLELHRERYKDDGEESFLGVLEYRIVKGRK